MRVAISSIFLSILTVALPLPEAAALEFTGDRPSGANLAVAKSDTSDVHIDATSGDYDLEVEGTKARLYFTDFDNVTHEVLLGVYLKKKNKKTGRVVKKYYTADDARERGICRKGKARGLYHFRKSVNDGLELQLQAVTDSEQNVSHFELTEITGLSNLKKSLKSYTSRKKADVAKLDDDCNRADGLGW